MSTDAIKTLDVNAKQVVQYCAPLWLRDEQIRVNCARITERIQPHERRTDPVAIVCFGPSLNVTWEQVRDFTYVISCSGSHKFLRERGITPTWHVEVDPRAHKVGLMGEPCHDTEYLISSTCHPKLLDHLAGFNVKLWHVFDCNEDGRRLLPHGEWALTGGCDVGLRALTIAAFLGFRDLHVFGMDHSAGTVDAPAEKRHAADHPHSGTPKDFSVCEVDGIKYLTTSGMLSAAQSVPYELGQLKAVQATFYGEGLCQTLMKQHQQKEPTEPPSYANVIGFTKPVLISAEYADLNARLHSDNLAYGVGGGKHASVVLKLISTLNTQSVLDYGCGKGYLAKSLPFPIWEYDPAVPGKTESPRPADIVVCTDVLEHVEPDRLAFVLDDLARVTRQIGYFVIHTGPAQKTLADGRNTHLLQKSADWWAERLARFFEVAKVMPKGIELHFLVVPKKHLTSAQRVAALIQREEATA